MPNYRLFKRPESDNWQVQIGRATPKSSGTDDYEKAKDFAETLANEAWRVNKLGDRAAVSFKAAALKYLTFRGLRLLPFRPSPSERKKIREQDKAARRSNHSPDEYNMPWLVHHIGETTLREIAEDPEVLTNLALLGLEEGHVEGEGWSHSTVDRVMNTASAVLGYAHKLRWLSAKPPIPKFNKAVPEVIWWNPIQYAELVRNFNDVRQELTSRFALNSLLRMQSMLGMKKSRIDLQARTAWVPGYESKSGQPIPYALSWELRYLAQELMRLNPDGDHLFQYDGAPIGNCNTAAFKKARARAEVPGNWHTHRHTGAAWMLKSGATLQEVQKQGGWKTLAAVQIYAHLDPRQLQDVADRFGTLAANALRGISSKTGASSWAVTDSNRGPTPCKDVALPTELTARPEPVPVLIAAEPVGSRIVIPDGIFSKAKSAPTDPRGGAHTSGYRAIQPEAALRGQRHGETEPTPAAVQMSHSEHSRVASRRGRDIENAYDSSEIPSIPTHPAPPVGRLVSATDPRKNGGLAPIKRHKKAHGGR